MSPSPSGYYPLGSNTVPTTSATVYTLIRRPFVLDTSPDINNVSHFANCTKEQKESILDYDGSKLQLVDAAIPILSILFSIFALIINVIFMYLVIRGLREKKLPFKGYSLLLNRSATDIVTSILTILFVALHKMDLVSGNPEYPPDERNMTIYEMDYLIPHGRTWFTLLLTVNFWSAAGAYAVLALFTYFAVRHPMFYIVKVTDRITVYVMIGVSVVGILYSILVVCISSNNAFNVFNDSKDLIQWSVSSEDYVLSISNLFIVMISFGIVSISYVAIMIYLYRKSQESGNANLHLMSIGRLALNIFAFSFSCVVMAVFVAIPLFLKGHIDFLLEEIQKSECRTIVETYKLSFQMAQYSTIAMVGWQLRMIVDPLANLMLDARFKLIYEPFCARVTIPPISHSPTASEFLGKMARANVIPSSILSGEGHYFRFRSATESNTEERQSTKPKRSNLVRFENVMLNHRVL